MIKRSSSFSLISILIISMSVAVEKTVLKTVAGMFLYFGLFYFYFYEDLNVTSSLYNKNYEICEKIMNEYSNTNQMKSFHIW